MNINYEYYKTFYYVGKYKNLTIAASEMNNNQPNISRTIKLLEEETGCKLIVRKSHGIELTPEGEKLYSYVKSAISQLEAGEKELDSILNMKHGIITVCASETAAYMVVLPALKAFKSIYPDIKINLISHNAYTSIEYAKQGLVDFSISTINDFSDNSLQITPVLTYTDCLAGGPSYSHFTTPMTLEDINKYPLIALSNDSATYKFYKTLFNKNNLEYSPQYEVETSGQLCPMLMYDLGLAFIPELYIKSTIHFGIIHKIPLADNLPERKICIIENKNKHISIAAQKLKEYCMTPREFISF